METIDIEIMAKEMEEVLQDLPRILFILNGEIVGKDSVTEEKNKWMFLVKGYKVTS
ncbi:hypothetical protein SOV_36120 [Sporomusa ovata DSM 2662]|uniref:Uncharacterized protein n=1 Tax=Sporomusa ovata TaxID=2378 RepID=A0A0U1L5Z2_9FIRM|nr:hypothetical protein SOV_6c01750 [Sporomusa ovata DSM 2662]CQR75107.1 hypothetical protein SpAn4DRAFT_4471 [Sporomusa ovata]